MRQTRFLGNEWALSPFPSQLPRRQENTELPAQHFLWLGRTVISTPGHLLFLGGKEGAEMITA